MLYAITNFVLKMFGTLKFGYSWKKGKKGGPKIFWSTNFLIGQNCWSAKNLVKEKF